MSRATEWQLVRLGEFARLRKGVSYKGTYLDQPGPLLLGLGTIVPGGGLKLKEARSYAGPIKDHQYISPGEVLIALTDITQDGRVLGSPAWISPRIAGRFAVTHHVARVEILRPELVDVGFLYYAIQTPEARDYMRGMATGTTVRAVSPGDVESYDLVLPPLPEQHAIAEVLGALDDKIEANNRVIARADHLWQIHLNAVLDDAEESEALSGDDFRPLSSLAEFINGRAFTKNATGYGRMVIRIAELKSGSGPSTVYNDITVSDQYLARPGDLLFAWSGSLTVQRWYRQEAIINQHIFKVIPQSGIPAWFVHGQLLRLLPHYRGVAAGKATTMGHIQRRDLDVLVAVPSRAAIAAMDSFCGPLWARALAAERETLTLASLRDALLPKLLSGELRVRDAEHLVEEAV